MEAGRHEVQRHGQAGVRDFDELIDHLNRVNQAHEASAAQMEGDPVLGEAARALRKKVSRLRVRVLDRDQQMAHAGAFFREAQFSLWDRTVLPMLREAYLAAARARIEERNDTPAVGRPRERETLAFIEVLRAEPWNLPWRLVVFAIGALSCDSRDVDPEDRDAVDKAANRLNALLVRSTKPQRTTPITHTAESGWNVGEPGSPDD